MQATFPLPRPIQHQCPPPHPSPNPPRLSPSLPLLVTMVSGLLPLSRAYTGKVRHGHTAPLATSSRMSSPLTLSHFTSGFFLLICTNLVGRLFAGRNVYSSASSPNWAPWYRSAGDVPARDVPAPTPDAAPMTPVEPTAPVAEPTPSDSGDSGNGKFRVVLADLVRRFPWLW